MTAESTLVGHVCQLNYGWGGHLEYSTVAGSQHVPFSSSTLPLRIGQEVAFHLQCEGNRIEAVNLQAPSSPPSSRSNDANNPETKNRFQTAEASISDVLSPTSASPILQRQIQRLQQRIAVFGNASQEEQCQMVLQAERALDVLLDETDLDGDALCRLVRRCASWLHAPNLSAATKKPLDEEATSASQEITGHFNLQQRVRKLLIRALSQLDLRDGPTFQALEASLLYVALFIQSLEDRHGWGNVWLNLDFLVDLQGNQSNIHSNIYYQILCVCEVRTVQVQEIMQFVGKHTTQHRIDMRSKSWTLNMSGERGLFQNIPATCHSSMVSLVPVASKAFAAACWRSSDRVGGRVTAVEVKISRKEPEDWRCWGLQESVCWKSVPTLNKDTKAFYSVSRFVKPTCWAEVLRVFIYYHQSFAICIREASV